MAIEYRCEHCGDHEPAYWHEEKERWERPRGWWELDVPGDLDQHWHTLCSPACVIGFVEGKQGNMRSPLLREEKPVDD